MQCQGDFFIIFKNVRRIQYAAVRPEVHEIFKLSLLETLWELQCLKTYSELTEELKKSFYYECQGITAVAMNLFILAQERALFDEGNPNEIITPQVLKKTAKEDMQTIQPMMTAIRTN